MNVIEQHKDLVEVIDLALAAVDGAFEIFEDGKVGLSDLSTLYDIYKKLNPAIKDFHKVKDSLKSLSVEDAKIINEYFDSKFDLENDVIEKYIEMALDLIVTLADTFDLLKENKKKG